MTHVGGARHADTNAAMHQARLLQLHEHPAAPGGAEVHARGVRHEVQRGDSLYGIAREYSQQFHMNITPAALREANRTAVADGLQPRELLRIPGLDPRLDSFFMAENPRLEQRGSRLQHVVARGETLSAIARRYNEANDLRLSWQDVYAANRTTIGSNPGKIRPGQALSIPGITSASPKATLQTLSELDQDVVLTRTGRVRHEDGSIETIDVVRFRADGSHATQAGSLDGAIRDARAAVSGPSARSTLVTVAQARDGAYWVVPVRGEEASENLDDSDRTLSLAYRADERGVVAVVERQRGGASVRRFDV